MSDVLQTDLSFLYLASRVLEFLNPDLKRLSLADVTQDIRASMMEEVPARLPPASPLASEWELGGALQRDSRDSVLDARAAAVRDGVRAWASAGGLYQGGAQHGGVSALPRRQPHHRRRLPRGPAPQSRGAGGDGGRRGRRGTGGSSPAASTASRPARTAAPVCVCARAWV